MAMFLRLLFLRVDAVRTKGSSVEEERARADGSLFRIFRNNYFVVGLASAMPHLYFLGILG